MLVKTHRTNKIKAGDDIYKILDSYLPKLEENTVVVITSKIISLCQNQVVKNDGSIDKKELIMREADWYFEDHNLTKYGTVIPTIKNNVLIANSGIDESNADGYFILWPKNLQESTNEIWDYLKEKHAINNLGVIITDSHLLPLRFGTNGVGLSWCGFEALVDYRGKKDIFKRELKMSQLNLLDGFSASAVTTMGEGAEQTPLATIIDIPFVKFQNRPPTNTEIKNLKIEKEDDIYGKLLTSVKWKKGGGGK